MTPNTINAIVSTALHPGTDEHTAVAAFRKLHQNASAFGGLSVLLGGSGADMRQRLTRAENEAVELRAQFGRANSRISEIERQRDDAAREANKARQTADRAEAECARHRDHATALEMKISDLSANADDLGIIKQRNAEIEELAVRLRAATQKLSAVESAQEQYVAARVAEARRDIENRVRAALGGNEDKIEPDMASEADSAPQPRRKAARAKRAASASARTRPRADQSKRRGRDTEQLVLDLLTFEWKSVSTLFRSARQIGFSGTENAIRFAAERLVEAGNALQGRNAEGHVAFCRA